MKMKEEQKKEKKNLFDCLTKKTIWCSLLKNAFQFVVFYSLFLLSFPFLKNIFFKDVDEMKHNISLLTKRIDINEKQYFEMKRLLQGLESVQNDLKTVALDVEQIKSKHQSEENVLQIQEKDASQTNLNDDHVKVELFIKHIKKGNSFENAFSVIDGVVLNNEIKNLIQELKNVYNPDLTLEKLNADFTKMRDDFAREEQQKPKEKISFIQKIKNYLSENIRISIGGHYLFKNNNADLETANHFANTIDINKAIDFWSVYRDKPFVAKWLEDAKKYQAIQNIVHQLEQINKGYLKS